MNVSRKTTTKDGQLNSIYTLTGVTALEYDTICRGLELAQDLKNDHGIRAFNMLRRLEDLREKKEG